jgi:para-nitrobenzyl esterase
VFAPKNASKLPVVVYIYGGGFDTGSAVDPIYNGTAMVDRSKVIYVSLNYRLGVFGFFSGYPETQGDVNVGLLDQKMALEWVRENIAAFGGDDTKITVMGQSAGAISIGAHLMYPEQKLFDRAILLSGGPLLRYAPRLEKQQQFDSITKSLNCTDLECLKSVDAITLKDAFKDFGFGIVLGGYVQQQATTNLFNGQFSKIPLLLQSTRDEGTFFATSIQTPEAVKPFIRGATPYFNETTFLKLDELYSVEKYPSPLFAAGDYFGDFVFQCSIKLTSEKYTTQTSVFNSIYNHRNKIDFLRTGRDIGIFHGADLPFLFLAKPVLDASEFELANKYHDEFMGFVKSGRTSWVEYGDGNRFDIASGQVIKDTERIEKCQVLINAFLDLNK